jgi:hypothetical protein
MDAIKTLRAKFAPADVFFFIHGAG